MKKVMRTMGEMSLRGKIALAICVVFILIAIFANVLAVHPYDKISGKKFEAPSLSHPLGTNDLGIDIWAQMCSGARISLGIGVSVALVSSLIGGIAGLTAAFYSKRADTILMTICNILQAVPDVPIIIVLAAFFGRNMYVMVLTLALLTWTNTARVIRARALAFKKIPYVKLSLSYGASFFHIFKEHLFWEIWPLWMISFAQLVGKAVVMEATMAFLGLGDPTVKSWGIILNNALNYRGIYYTDYWKWWIVPPVIAIALLVTSLSTLVAEFEKMSGMKGAHG